MKTTFRNLLIAVLLMSTSIASAQQVNTLYFLEIWVDANMSVK